MVPNLALPAEIVELELLDPAVRDYVQAATSDNTRRAYRSDLQHFIGCQIEQLLGPEAAQHALHRSARQFAAGRSEKG
jgi:hypothetical protein